LANGVSLAGARSGFAHSLEAQFKLAQLYDQVLGRAPDAAGLAGWTDALANGTSLSEARSGFAHSDEAQLYLAGIFEAAQGDAPDMAELAGLQNQLAAGGATLSSVQAELVNNGPSGAIVLAVPNDNQHLAALTSPEVFDFSSWTFGADSIVGFDPNQDTIQLSHHAVDGFDAVQARMSTNAGETLISLDSARSLTLDNVAPAALSAANFRFV
jgi:hypothetical protein